VNNRFVTVFFCLFLSGRLAISIHAGTYGEKQKEADPLKQIEPHDPDSRQITAALSHLEGNKEFRTTAGYELGVLEHRTFAGDGPSKATVRANHAQRLGDVNQGGVGLPSAATTSAGLVIKATFDSSITNHPNAAAIESAINQAIAIYQSLFSDPITIPILFRYTTTDPSGSPLDDMLALSTYETFSVAWSTYIDALKADAKTRNDAIAVASLPSSPLSTNIVASSAAARAIGMDAQPMMRADGSIGPGGSYDGIVTLNSSDGFDFIRPPTSTNYDALLAIEHEIDEILGLGSRVGSSLTNLRPEDLFSWSAPGTRNVTSSGTRYFSIDGGNTNIVQFSQDLTLDLGDWIALPCPQPNPYVQNTLSCVGQVADIGRTSPEGISLDVIGYDLVSPGTPNLLNLSTRLNDLTGDNVLIGGFIITGSTAKKVILRAIGPSLPIAGALADPTLELHQPDGTIVTNDNWKIDDRSGQSQEAEIRATTIPPSSDLESAVVRMLAPGAYTIIVRGKNGGTGIGLVEVYDLDDSTPVTLANISTRGFAETGDNVMIGGFIVGGGTGSSKFIVRAIGPSLPVPGALADPTLALHDGNGVIIATNDNWKINDATGESQEADIRATTIPPSNDLESALVSTLARGNYTVILSGKNGGTGVGLVEVYELQ
jgi:hypothetical protein